MSDLCVESKLQIALSQVNFYPGQEVVMKIPGIKAIVLTVKINEQGVLYECEYWSNEACINVHQFGHELEALG